MAQHNHTGRTGEEMAFEWLIEKDYIILHRNWRHGHWEVDIIASRNGVLHFIEVKTRTSLKFGHPEESVSIKKIRYLIDASAEYLYLNPQWKRVQFDVLSITISGEKVEYFFIEDVYL